MILKLLTKIPDSAELHSVPTITKNPNLSIGIFSITSLSTFFFWHTNRRIDHLLNRL